jgi:hypothetical protein
LMFCFCFSPFNPLFFLGSLLCFNAWNFRNTGGNWMSYCNMSSPRFFGKLFGDWSDRHGDTSMIFIAGYSHYRSGLQTISHGYSSLVTIARMSLFQCCEWVKLRWFHPP